MSVASEYGGTIRLRSQTCNVYKYYIYFPLRRMHVTPFGSIKYVL